MKVWLHISVKVMHHDKGRQGGHWEDLFTSRMYADLDAWLIRGLKPYLLHAHISMLSRFAWTPRYIKNTVLGDAVVTHCHSVAGQTPLVKRICIK